MRKDPLDARVGFVLVLVAVLDFEPLVEELIDGLRGDWATLNCDGSDPGSPF